MNDVGIFKLPFDMWSEAKQWTEQMLQRQGKFLDLALRSPLPPTWHTSNRVVFEAASLQLRQFYVDDIEFEYKTDHFCDSPVLVVTPQRNHASLCDYGPDQSLVHTLLEQGYSRVYVTDWKSASKERNQESLDDTFKALRECIQHIGEPVRLVGLSYGGWMALVYAALFAAEVEALVLAAAPIDFRSVSRRASRRTHTFSLALCRYMLALGADTKQSSFFSKSFASLSPIGGLLGSYRNLYQQLNDESYIQDYKRFTDWLNATQRLPLRSHFQRVKELLMQNRLVNGTLQILGEVVNLANVECPLYLMVGTQDIMVDPSQLLVVAQHVSSPVIRKFKANTDHMGVMTDPQTLHGDWTHLLQSLHGDKRSLEA